jgi:hypothetical protein
MDYTPINLAPVAGKQGNYFQGQPGVWDRWVIAYGYTPFDPDKEDAKLAEIASRCAEPLLDYGTDEDAFGMSTRGIDPTCNMFDLSSDPIDFYGDRIDIAHEIWDNLFEDFEKEGGSYKKLLYVFSQGLSEYSSAAHNIAKNIGGLYTYRDHIGDPDGRPPFEIVPAAQQRRAIIFLKDKILAPEAFDFSPELLNKLVYEKMGTFTGGIWSRSRLDYPIHSVVANIQAVVLSHLYDPLVLNRLVDNELRFSEDEAAFTIDEMYSLMHETIWQELPAGSNINSFRRELQRMYIYRLRELLLQERDNIPHDAAALSHYYFMDLKQKIEQLDMINLDRMTVVHLQDIAQQIDKALEAEWKE